LISLRGARLHEALTHTVQHQDRLLLNVLDRHKPHVGPRHGLADRLCIGRVVLVGLHVGLDELRRHQLDSVTKGCELARPVMSTAACFHADQARRQVHEKLGHLITLELLLQDGLAVFIDCVNLKHVLCQVDANCCNLHGGRLSRFKWLI